MSGKRGYPNVLLIRHLPKELSIQDQKEFIKHFGATDVKCMGNKGPLKYTAFAEFKDHEYADKALKRLHQFTVLGNTLRVEFSRKQFSEVQEGTGSEFVKLKLKELVKDKESDSSKSKPDVAKPDVHKVQNQLDSISEKWNIRYSINENLRYSYPPPNVSILTNIANALAAVPKFYVQVLHLMNKMNLPAPFGVVTSTPPLPAEPPPREHIPLPEDIHQPQEEMEISSTEESELESESEETIKKNTIAPLPEAHIKKRKLLKEHNKELTRKKPRLQEIISAPKSQKPAVRPEEVFDQNNGVAKKSALKFQLTPSSTGDVTTIPRGQVNEPEGDQEEGQITEKDEAPTVSEGGFGKLEPVVCTQKAAESSGEEEEELGEMKFVSSRTLRRGRLSERERREYNVFKNYQRGEANTRLYVKNLTKQTVEKDLHRIFGKYVNWDDDNDKNMFDIRLLREGRMKGQCFITLGSARKAENALDDTNGYVLNGKPMVVQFARSAKVKDTEGQEKSNSARKS